ncbi:MAG: alpha/beta fold hydrolase [Nocardioidaceae bacterium]
MSRLLLIPGIGLGREAWEPTLRHLGDRALAHVETLPGYGLRTDGDDDLRPAVLAERLRPLLDPRLAGETGDPSRGPTVLVGHSASCQIVVHAARYWPDRVRGLVLIGPTTDPRASTWPRLAARWLATARHEDPRQVPALVKQYHRTGLDSMRRAMEAARHDRIEVTLRGTECPVLVLRGLHDRICPVSWSEELTGARAGAAWSGAVTLSRGGHMVPLTRGRLVADEIIRFLRRVDSLTSDSAEAGPQV